METAQIYDEPPEPASVSARRLIAWLTPILSVGATFIIATIVYNISPAVAGSSAHNLASRVLTPYLAQNWRLFGPNPPESVDHMLLQVRYRPAGSTDAQPQVSTPIDIKAILDALPSANPVFPSKLPGYSLALWRQFAQYAVATLDAERKPIASRATALAHLDRASAPQRDVLDRFLSKWADDLFPRGSIVSVRCTFTRQNEISYRWRQNPQRRANLPFIEYQTAWLPYVAKVA